MPPNDAAPMPTVPTGGYPHTRAGDPLDHVRGNRYWRPNEVDLSTRQAAAARHTAAAAQGGIDQREICKISPMTR